MQEYWFFVVANAQEHPIAYASCDFMGRYAELMNRLAEDQWGQSWMRYASFTQRDYDEELHAHLGIDKKKLPLFRNRFEPEEGLQKLGKMRAYFLLHESAIVKNEWVRQQDFEAIIVDFNTAIDVLKKGLEIGEKWFLDVDVD